MVSLCTLSGARGILKCRARMQLFQWLTGLVEENNRDKQISDAFDPRHLLNRAYTDLLKLGVVNSCVVSGKEMLWNTLPLDQLREVALNYRQSMVAKEAF